MWLRNYYNALTAIIYSQDTLTSTTMPTSYSAPIMVRDVDGSYTQSWFNNTSAYASSEYWHKCISNLLLPGKMSLSLSTASSAFTNMNLYLGSGSTPVSYEDYRLDTLITSGLSIVSSSGTIKTPTDISGSEISSKKDFTINNTSSGNITISEIGLAAGVGAAVSSNYGGRVCMIYREVLDEPVTLAPGESMILSFDRTGTIYNYTPYPA